MRLATEDGPEQAGGFVTINFAEGGAGGGVQEVDQLGILFLLKMVEGAADEPVGAEFTAQGEEFGATAGLQNGLGDAEGAAEAGDDAAHGRDFDLGGGVADEINMAVADALSNGDPLAIDGNARALPLEGLEMFFFKEAFEAALGVASLFADHAKSGAFGVFRDEPIKIRSVVGDEPNASGIGGAILGQADDGLH